MENNVNTLASVRRNKGISQSELSKLTGYTQGYLSMFESGKRAPSYENLLKISEALGCSVEEISCLRTIEHLSNTIKDHLQNMTEVELEKVIDYIETIKRGRK